MDFKAYHAALKNREPRPFFLEALSYLHDADAVKTALDLGFGDGAETRYLLAKGWQVTAIDREASAVKRLWAGLEPEWRSRFKPIVSSFEKASYAEYDFIYAGLSLPYVAKADFEALWSRLSQAVKPKGTIAAHFFGQRNELNHDFMTIHREAELKRLFQDFDLLVFRELEEVAESALGQKRHWHYFEVIASKP
ncbi:MAG: class I SAM-dependent methyltransferase [Trueperaceae bacterium]|nr:class I SAM-dependent methyltransferase [Trueperaceae bacterium]